MSLSADEYNILFGVPAVIDGQSLLLGGDPVASWSDEGSGACTVSLVEQIPGASDIPVRSGDLLTRP